MVIQNEKNSIGVLLLLSVLLLLTSCKKNGSDVSQSLSPHRVVSVQTGDSKTSGDQWWVSGFGHDGKTCPGCVMYNGKMIHRDCMHHGNCCRAVTRVNVTIDGTDITATTTDTFGLTTEDFFMMPDRSLDYTDENNNRIFLNIPQQLVFRDTATQQFTFTGLFFSTTAAYTND